MLCEQLKYHDGDSFTQSELSVAFNKLHPVSVSEPEDKNLDHLIAIQMQFILHNTSIIKRKQYSFYSRAHLSCFLGVRQNRIFSVWGLVFYFNFITINPNLVTGNYNFFKRFLSFALCMRSSVQSLGTNFSGHQCVPKFYVKFVKWINGYFIVFCNFSVNRLPISIDNALHPCNRSLDLEVEDQPDCSFSYVKVLSFLKCDLYEGRHLIQRINTVSFMQHIKFSAAVLLTMNQNVIQIFAPLPSIPMLNLTI
jgi:hypothetical protein